jgi:hypothetical protein
VHLYGRGFKAGSPQYGSNAHDLWIGLGLDAKGVPSRVIGFWVIE